MVRLGTQMIVFRVCRERVLGIINLLSSMGRIWVSCHHRFIVGGGGMSCASVAWWVFFVFFFFFAKQACLVLWLSKSAFLSNHQLLGSLHIFSIS